MSSTLLEKPSATPDSDSVLITVLNRFNQPLSTYRGQDALSIALGLPEGGFPKLRLQPGMTLRIEGRTIRPHSFPNRPHRYQRRMS
jgi:hypothetical protein